MPGLLGQRILGGRPRSPLLIGTAGDDGGLWRYRTEPVTVVLNVWKVLVDLGAAGVYDDDAVDELQRRQEAAEAADPPIDYERYCWVYEPGPDRTWVASDSEAPDWSLDAWRADQIADGATPSTVAAIKASLWEGPLGPPLAVYASKSPADRDQLCRPDNERNARLASVHDLDDQLEVLEKAELAAYGAALKQHVEAGAQRWG